MQRLKQLIANLKYLTRFNIIVGMIFVLILIALFNILSVRTVHDNIQTINKNQYNELEQLSKLKSEVTDLVIDNQFSNIGYRSLVQIRKSSAMIAEQIQQILSSYRENISGEDELLLFEALSDELENYKNINREVSSLYASNRDSLANSIRTSREKRSIEQVNSVFDRFYQLHQQKNDVASYQIQTGISSYLWSTILFIVISAILALVVTLLFVKEIPSDIHKLKLFLTKLLDGEYDQTRNFEIANNELGEIEVVVNDLAKSVGQIQYVAKMMAAGHYDFDFKALSTKDIIGKSIIELKSNLQTAKEEEIKRFQEESNRNWLSQGLAVFGDMLRQHTNDVNQLSGNVIKKLVKYLDANQGGFFILVDKNPDDLHLALASAFAYDRTKFFQKRIDIGEGLIGMVALEKNTVFITDIPKDYIEIESGLGDSSPTNLLIVPLKLDDNVLGIIELASFTDFSQIQIEFVEQLAESIASTLAAVKINAKTAHLLSQSQKQAEELAMREQELRANVKEIRATQEEAARKGAEMMGILTAVDFALLKVEYDKEGNLLTANQRFLNTMEYMLDEIKKKNIETFIPDDLIGRFRTAWTNLLQGNAYKTTYKTATKTGKDIWLLAQYTPVFDENKNILKILYLANDITEQKQMEEAAKLQAEQLEKQESELAQNLQALKIAQKEQLRKELEVTGLLTAIDNAMIKVEFDVFGQITVANQMFQNVLGFTLDGKEKYYFNSFDLDGSDNSNIWKFVMEDNSYSEIIKMTNKVGADLWLLVSMAPVKNSENKIEKVLLLANDVTKQKQSEEETQKNAEMLREQEEQMRLNMEEMMQIQDDMAKTEAEMKGFLEAVDHTLIKGEYDTTGVIINVNELFSEALGYKKNEIIGQHVFTIVPEEDHKKFEEVWPLFLKGKVTRNQIVKRIAKDGSTLWLLMSCTPIKDENDEISKILFLAKDVTEQKQIEQKFKKQNEDLELQEIEMQKNMEELLQIQEESLRLQEKIAEEDNNIRTVFETEIEKLYKKWLDSL